MDQHPPAAEIIPHQQLLSPRASLGLPQLPAAAEHHDQVNLFKLLHRALRGRYLFVIIAGVLAMVGGAITGYTLEVPKYQVDAIIRVQPRMPRIMSDEASVTPMFASFVSTQASLVGQDRVISRAMNSEEWKKIGRPNTPAEQESFRRALRVRPSREAPELINVSFLDIDAVAAKTGLEQTLKAYEAIFGQGESRQVTQFTLNTLETRRRTLADDIARKRQDIRGLAAEYGTEDLTQLHRLQMERVLEAERRMGEIELQLAQNAGAPNQEGAAARPAAPELDPTDIARIDTTMAQHIARRSALHEQLDALSKKGFGSEHPDVKMLQAEFDAAELTIATYARTWHEAREAGRLSPGELESPDQLRARLEALRSQANRWRDEVVVLGNKRLDIMARQAEITTLTQSLDEVNRRIEEVNVESKVEQDLGRIEVILPEGVPSSPTADPRKKYAAMGGVMGAGGVLAIACLLGLLDRRFRYSDQVIDSTRRPLLACLPEVNADPADENTLGAAHNVHRIRAMLQIASPHRRTIVVTSPSAGDGKTSVSISLGMSFAAVGERTLIIDLDLIGHGLTTRLGLAHREGLLSALAAGTPEGRTVSLRESLLSALPIEHGDESAPASLRRSSIRTLLARAVELYDCVIVDTGPIMGSLEASYAASMADGTLIVVGRGQPRQNFERAVEHLRDVGATLLGVVFNRARGTDFRQSNVSASVRTSTRPANAPPPAPRTPRKSIDPLVDAVAADIPDDAPAGRAPSPA